jgi:hypothetical protein
MDFFPKQKVVESGEVILITSTMERLKKFLENPIWRLSIDIAQILGISIFTLVGYTNIFFRLVGKRHSLLTIILTLFFLFLAWGIRNRFADLSKKIKVERVNSESEKIQKNFEKDFEKGIPSNRMMKSWFELIEEKAQKWDSGSSLVSLNLYMVHGYETEYYKPKPKIQAFYYSGLKRLKADFYAPSISEIGGVEEQDFSPETIKPFFIEFPKWGQALRVAYRAISDILPKKFTLIISGYGGGIGFRFNYTQGALSKKYEFSYNGEYLRSDKLGKEVKI